MRSPIVAAFVVALLLSASVPPAIATPASAQEQLSAHWVPGWGFRDELNRSDIDYQNFWTDNAGKILAAGIFVDDPNDTARALSFIQGHMTSSYYLPEVVVNSSIIHPPVQGGSEISNRIVELNTSATASPLKQLSIGDYYAGGWNSGYIGADRIWYDGSAHRANSSIFIPLANGYVKRSYFSFGELSFYTYLNATIAAGSPYVRVSLQVLPMDSTFGAGDHVDLQVFGGASGDLASYAFENATLFSQGGNIVGAAPFDSAEPTGQSSMLVAYSNRTGTLTEDSVAVRYNSTSISSVEHWRMDGPFDGLSWVGLGYNVPMTAPGTLSPPVYADVYPIQHMDFRLLSDTAGYIFTNPSDVAVSPPVSFGFIAWGLAVASHANDTLASLAKGYWDLYYDRYQGTKPDLAYARAISLTALAGFELYGGNSTVERFTRYFLGAYPGSSIEEFGWDVAALGTLYLYSGSATDYGPLQRVEGSFVPGGSDCLGLDIPNPTIPGWTFQYGEAAAGMLVGGVPYNSPDVIWAMNAVFASNTSGIIENSPLRTDMANTEALPAYMMAAQLFEGAMKSRTGGYWVRWTHDANITSIGYEAGHLTIDVTGADGTVALGTSGGGTVVFSGIDGSEILRFPPPSLFPWYLLAAGAVLAALAVLLYVRIRLGKRIRQPRVPTTGSYSKHNQTRGAVKLSAHSTLSEIRISSTAVIPEVAASWMATPLQGQDTNQMTAERIPKTRATAPILGDPRGQET